MQYSTEAISGTDAQFKRTPRRKRKPADCRLFITGKAEAGQGAQHRRPATARGHCPPLVIRGAECQASAKIDYWRSTAPTLSKLGEGTQRLAEWFGPWQHKAGRYHYASRYEFANGAAIHFTREGEEGNAGMMFDLSGSPLSDLPWRDLIDLLRWMLDGMTCTRFDLALDYRGEAVPLIGLAIEACERGELCRCRVWKPETPYRDQELTGYGINFGRRGKEGSGRYMRWYDKGLETGKETIGRWVRLEAELSKKHAHKAACEVLGADNPMSCIAPITLGCVDFRENTGDAHLDRRPLVDWWSEVLAGIETVRLSVTRPPRRVEAFAAWVRRCVAPTIAACATLTDGSMGDVLDDLAAGLPLGIDAKNNPVAWQYAQELFSRARLRRC